MKAWMWALAVIGYASMALNESSLQVGPLAPAIATQTAFDPTTSLTEAHRIAHDAEHTLTHAVPKLSSALIHAYPATTDIH